MEPLPSTLRDVFLEAEQLRTEVTIICVDGCEVRGAVTDVGTDVITISDGPNRHDLALFHVVRIAW